MSDRYGQFSGDEFEPRERQKLRLLIQRQEDRDAFDRLGGRGKVIAGWIATAIGLWAAFEFVVKAALAS